MSKELVTDESVEEIIKKEEEKTFGEQFDFMSMFRVKEKQGLFYPISGVNKADMLCVTGIFESGGKCIVKADRLICLGHFEFQTTEMETIQVPAKKEKAMQVVGEEVKDEEIEMVEIEQLKRLSMSDVFTNLSNYAIKSEDYAFEKATIEELMGWMCPDYDKDQFKLYHAKQVLGWYIEVTLKYSALIDSKVESGEVEILTEEEAKEK
jgi:hypothetical protein